MEVLEVLEVLEEIVEQIPYERRNIWSHMLLRDVVNCMLQVAEGNSGDVLVLSLEIEQDSVDDIMQGDGCEFGEIRTIFVVVGNTFSFVYVKG